MDASDDGSPPVDFKLSTSLDESVISLTREKCHLCKNYRKTFYCKDCIEKGDFVSSTPTNAERFAEKRLRLLKLQEEKNSLTKSCLKIIEKMETKTKLMTDIKECRERIKLLKELVKKKKESIKNLNKEVDTIREKNKARVMRLPRYKERVEKLQQYVEKDVQLEIKERRNKVNKAQTELQQIIRSNIEDLVHYIFPIHKIDPIDKSDDGESDSAETVTALAEATRTSYIRGKWVFMDSSGEVQYRIVAPTLPGSGDYSAYFDWVATIRKGIPDNDKLEKNQAYNISAALGYTTQLVNLLAFYLDIILPKKLNFTDFYNLDISDNKFNKKISKLNSNILYLGFSQGIDTFMLNPKQTLGNVLHLVCYPNLGVTDPFEIDSNLVMSLESFEIDLKAEEGSEEEENDYVTSEWEAIPLVPCPESVPGSAVISHHQCPNSQASTSMAGGLIMEEEEEEGKLKYEQEKILSQLCEMMSQSSEETALCEEDLDKISENDTYFAIRDAINEKEKVLLSSKAGSAEKNTKKKSGRLHRGRKKRCRKKNGSENVEKASKRMKLVSGENVEGNQCCRIVEQSNDSGIGTSSEQFARAGTPEAADANLGDVAAMVASWQKPSSIVVSASTSSQDSIASKESVSLLQNTDTVDCNVQETNNYGAERAISVAWNIKIFPTLSDDQEDEEEVADEHVSIVNKANKCVQTEWEFRKACDSETVQKSIHFLRCLIEMKNVFSTKVDVPKEKVLNILKNVGSDIRAPREAALPSSPSLPLPSPEEEEEEENDSSMSEDSKDVIHALKNLDIKKRKMLTTHEGKETWRRRDEKERKVPRETIHYIMRTTDAENVMERSVDSLLLWLKKEMEKDLRNLCRYWKNSIMEDVAEMLNLAVDSDNGSIRRKVSDLLQKIVDEIYSPESPVEDSLLEYKISLLANLCQSIYLEYDLITHLEKKLETLKEFKWIQGDDEHENKLLWIRLVKASYLLLRLLEELLQRFFLRLNESGIRELLERREKKSEWNVVELWRKYWRKAPDPKNEEAGCGKKCMSVVSEWLSHIDGMVKLSVKEAPLLTVAAQKCSSKAREILLLIENAESDSQHRSLI